MKLRLSKEDGRFMVDNPKACGSPRVGFGRTIREAIGDYFHGNQKELGIEFDVDKSAWPAELRRRRWELSKR